MYTTDQVTAISVGLVLPLLAVIAVVLRFLARRQTSSPIGMDDWFIVAGMIICVSQGAMMIWGAVSGCYGTPLQTMTLDQMVNFEKIIYIAPTISIGALGFTKLSVLFFYRRIFTTPAFRIQAWVFVFLVSAWTIATLVGQIFEQWPVSKNWRTKSNDTNFILNYEGFLMATAALDLVLDVGTLCLPIYPISKLHMKRGKKLALLAIFLLGVLATVAEAVRIYYTWVLLYGPIVAGTEVTSNTETIIQIINWFMIEICVSCVAACLPTLRSVFVAGPSTRSLVSKFRSFASLNSNSSSTETKQNEFYDSEAAAMADNDGSAAYRHFHRVGMTDSFITPTQTWDEQKPNVINIERSFGTQEQSSAN